MSVILRPTARVLLLDPSDRVLLFFAYGDSTPHIWITPGGGQEPGETLTADLPTGIWGIYAWNWDLKRFYEEAHEAYEKLGRAEELDSRIGAARVMAGADPTDRTTVDRPPLDYVARLDQVLQRGHEVLEPVGGEHQQADNHQTM